MDRLTVGVLTVAGLLTLACTKTVTILDAWYSAYRQRQNDRRLYGRNAIMTRMLEWTPSPSDPTQRDKN